MGGFVNPAAGPVTANGEIHHVIFHPAIVISPALIGIALVNGASVQAAQEKSPPEAPPSACQMRLAADRAVFKPLGEVAGAPKGPAGCGGKDVVLLQQIVLPDRTEVAVEPPATLRCEMAEAITDFVRDDLAPAAALIGSPLRALENDDSYDCRSRNGVAGAKLSEHGHANALDVRAIRLKDGRVVPLTDVAAPHALRAAARTAACDRFTTVLGPGSDGYHEDHVHLDRIERPSGYRLCQWDVRDEPRVASPGPSVASPPGPVAAALHGPIPLPRPRPLKSAAHAHLLPAESRH